METKNLEKLAFNLNSALTLHPMAHNILSPNYVELYLDIFYDEIALNKEPIHSDRFMDKLGLLIDMQQKNAQEILDDFEKIWNGWVMLYRNLQQKGAI